MNTPDDHTPTEDIITIPELQAKFAQLQADSELRWFKLRRIVKAYNEKVK